MAELIAEDRRKRDLLHEAEHQLFKREAKRLADSLERRDDRRPVRRSLAEELALPDEEEQYAIDGILPLGGNALFAARYKAGKTTFSGQLLRSWADGVPFLGKFQCHPDPEKPVVTYFNYEMSEGQFRRWMRRVGIRNTENVHVVNLRGISLPLSLADVREEVAGWLRDANTGLWVIDPASRAMAGMGDGSDNKDVSLFVGYLDEIKARADVRDMVLDIHMGHASSREKDAQRAIGAQAWSAWADALWYLNLKEEGGIKSRWFSAEGRDVSVEEHLVAYEAEDMSVALLDVNPERHEQNKVRNAVEKVIRENPAIGSTRIRSDVTAFCKARAQDIDKAVHELIDEGLVVVQARGRSRDHYWHDQMPQPITGD